MPLFEHYSMKHWLRSMDWRSAIGRAYIEWAQAPKSNGADH